MLLLYCPMLCCWLLPWPLVQWSRRVGRLLLALLPLLALLLLFQWKQVIQIGRV
jgi:hypothetical protein